MLSLQSNIFCKTRDPFRDPSLQHCLIINKIEIYKGIMLKMGYMNVPVGLGCQGSKCLRKVTFPRGNKNPQILNHRK